VTALADAHLLYGSAQEIVESGAAPGFQALIADVWRDRGFGDFWGYALVAEGAAEAMVEVGPKSWDLAAPLVIIEEAGGRLTDLDGQRTINSGTVLATNGHLHDEVLARLRTA
jgi:histidinol-phosphatase